MLQRLARLYKQTADDKSIKAHSTALVLVKPDSESPWGNQFGFLHVSAPELNGTRFSKPLEFVTIAQEIIQRKRSSLAVNLTGRLLEILSKFRGPEPPLISATPLPIEDSGNETRPVVANSICNSIHISGASAKAPASISRCTRLLSIG
ncbi:hypothetical protein OIU76_013858 [Salix suchowensis]|nr:hypothetical protein OIU76_013858 [Salix suchowensis]